MSIDYHDLRNKITDVNSPALIKIQASAGSGKTYILTICYAILLSHLDISLRNLRSILAITFTNRAADEMKQRILSLLKTIAIGSPQGKHLSHITGLSDQKARGWVDLIIKNYGEFQVMTIDSFIFSILRGISLEHGLRPDLKVEADLKWFINKAFEELLYTSNNDLDLKKEIVETITTFLTLEAKSGFFVEKKLQSFFGNFYERHRHQVRITSEGDLEATDISKTRDALIEACRDLYQMIIKIKDRVNGRISIECLNDPIRNLGKAIFSKNDIRELFLKQFRDTVTDKLIDLYEKIRLLRDKYLFQESIERVRPYTKLYKKLVKQLEIMRERMGLIPMGTWLDMSLEYISAESLPGIYALIGNKLRYLLIDEFQDTSKIQWEILKPLVENAISDGGKFVYVGDIKQSIYIWRDAEPRLFHNLELPGNIEEAHIRLPSNYRSSREVVEFNNKLYSTISDAYSRYLAKNLLYGSSTEVDEDEEEFLEKLESYIKNYYQDAKQTCATEGDERKGHVSVTNLVDGNSDEILHVLRNIIEKEKVNKRKLGDIAIIVRENKQAEEISEFLWANGYACITKNSLRIERCPIVNGLINLFRFLDFPDDILALVRFLIMGIIGDFDETDLFYLVNGKDEPMDLFKHLKQYHEGIYEYIIHLLEIRHYLTPYMIASKVIKDHKLYDKFPSYTSFISRFLDILLIMEGQGKVTIEEILMRLSSQEQRIGTANSVDAIRILTIHECKGLEFPVVILATTGWAVETENVVHLGNGVLAYARKPYSREINQRLLQGKVMRSLEALNLLYVATTRARDVLYIMVAPQRRFSISTLLWMLKEKNGI